MHSSQKHTIGRRQPDAPHASALRRSSGRFCGRSVAVTCAPSRASTSPALQPAAQATRPAMATRHARVALLPSQSKEAGLCLLPGDRTGCAIQHIERG